MNKNTLVSLRLHYKKSAIRDLDDLHGLVHTSMRELALPTPGRVHLKKIDDEMILIEQLSCNSIALNRLEKVMSMNIRQGNLQSGLVGIRRYSGLVSIKDMQLGESHPFRNSIVLAGVPTMSDEGPMSYPVSTSKSMAGKKEPIQAADSLITQHSPLSFPHFDPVKAASYQQLHPHPSIPPKPSWSSDPPPNPNMGRELPKVEPSPTTKVPPSFGNAGPPGVSEISEILPSKPRTRRIDVHIPSKRPSTPKRSRDVDVETMDRDQAMQKRRKLKNGSPHSPELPLEHGKPDRAADSRQFTGDSEEGSDRRDETGDGSLQRLRASMYDLEMRLHGEQNEVRLLREQLEEEKRKRIRAELMVADIRREVKEPFIVPSLVDAFVTLSDILNICVDED